MGGDFFVCQMFRDYFRIYVKMSIKDRIYCTYMHILAYNQKKHNKYKLNTNASYILTLEAGLVAPARWSAIYKL